MPHMLQVFFETSEIHMDDWIGLPVVVGGVDIQVFEQILFALENRFKRADGKGFARTSWPGTTEHVSVLFHQVIEIA